MRDPQPGLDPLRGSTPHRVLVLDRQDAVEAALVERVHVVGEVHLAETRDPVAPPAHVPGVLLARRGAAEEPEAVALGREGLRVLRVRVRHPIDVGPQRGHGVDAEPEQMRGVEVEIQPELEHPLPELWRIGEVARVAVRVPALHHAVLDHQANAPLAGVVHERREDALGLAQVVGDAAAGVAADEGADRDAAERGGGVDAGAQVSVVRLPLRRVGIQVVVVVGERREHEPVAVQRRPYAVGLRVVERVGRDMAGRERAVAQPRPGGELERLVAVRPGPGGDVLEAALGHASAQEAELHVATASWAAVTSTHSPLAADASTASVMRVERRPSANTGRPSGAWPVSTAS